jgi:hypothetical protein
MYKNADFLVVMTINCLCFPSPKLAKPAAWFLLSIDPYIQMIRYRFSLDVPFVFFEKEVKSAFKA